MAPVSADDVVRYLEENPGFFLEHPEMLQTSGILDSDTPSESVLNIRHRLFDRLNEERRELTEVLDETIELVRKNEQIEADFLAIEKLVFDPALSLAAMPRIAEEIEQRFGLDHASFLMVKSLDMAPLSRSTPETTDRVRVVSDEDDMALAVIEDGIALTGNLKEGASDLFPESSRADLGSTAVVRLQQGGQFLGVLLLGSKDPERYDKEMATQLLERLAMRLSIGIRLLQLLVSTPEKGSAPLPESEGQNASQSA